MECDCTTVHLFLNYVHVPHCRDIVCLPYTHSQYKAKWKAHELKEQWTVLCAFDWGQWFSDMGMFGVRLAQNQLFWNLDDLPRLVAES